MKQWLYYSWVKFKNWVFFTTWRMFHNKEDREELAKLYNERLFRKYSMKAYVDHITEQNKNKDESADLSGLSWYVGDLKPDRFEIVEKYYENKKEKKDE